MQFQEEDLVNITGRVARTGRFGPDVNPAKLKAVLEIKIVWPARSTWRPCSQDPDSFVLHLQLRGPRLILLKDAQRRDGAAPCDIGERTRMPPCV